MSAAPTHDPIALSGFFDALWADYVAMAPRAARTRALFEARGEVVENDHVAFRTLDSGPISLDRLDVILTSLGYRRFAPYTFDDKHLRAWSYVPPLPGLPRVFASELDSTAFSPWLRETLSGLAAQVDPARVAGPSAFWAGRCWAPVAFETYQRLLQESEYAAWVAALGLRPNHFTISVNRLVQTPTIEQVIALVEAEGIAINAAGGKVKGTPADLLVQASTLADRQEVEFAGGERHLVPTCYYEFALRLTDADGRLYEGFVPASANRIFESTDTRAVADR